MGNRLELGGRLALLLLLAGGVACAGLRGGAHAPERIAAAAQEQGCTPLGALPASEQPADPWWAGLGPVTGDPNDAAFLCRSDDDPSLARLVVSVGSPLAPWAGCPPLVGEIPWSPLGVTILRPGDAAYPAGTLGAWSDAAGNPGPADVELTQPVLDTSLQIAGDLYYCHDGRWFELFVH